MNKFPGTLKFYRSVIGRILLISGVCAAGLLWADNGAETTAWPVAEKTSAGLMRTVYLGLIRESIVPADPRVIASAALAKLAILAPERVRTLPAGFGVDGEKDAAWLAECVADLPIPWPVFEAMVRAADTAHVGVSSPQRRQGLGALMAGKPRAAPGFNVFPLPDGRRVVFDVIPGASAEVSGLRAGDLLLRIDGEPVNRADVFFLNALPVGAERKLDIERAGRPETVLLRFIEANVPAVESRLLDDGIGYVFIRWFAPAADAERNTAALALRAFTALAAQGARGLIIDLRSALGGSGEVAMASALCDGDVMYSVRQPLTAPARPVKREGVRLWPDLPIVVLVNEHTVSAGESFALSLRELAHAKIVGRTTAGALTEMAFVPLADGYVMMIPTGVVLGPVTGADQPGHAIKPDIEVANPTIDELLHGRDAQLDSAQTVLGAN